MVRKYGSKASKYVKPVKVRAAFKQLDVSSHMLDELQRFYEAASSNGFISWG